MNKLICMGLMAGLVTTGCFGGSQPPVRTVCEDMKRKDLDMKAINYDLVRFSKTERVVSLAGGEGSLGGFSTVATHGYHVIYNAGTIPGLDDQTSGRISFNETGLRFELTMQEPELSRLLPKMAEESTADFPATDLVSVNLIVPGNRLVQVMVKPDGKTRLIGLDAADISVKTGEKIWIVDISIPWKNIGMNAAQFEKTPLPFDVVRFQRGNGVVSSWAVLPDQLPFNDPYEFPAFCFGLLAAKEISWDALTGKTPDLGKLDYKGSVCMVAGSFNTLRFVYTAGANGLASSGSILFNIPNEVIECNRGTARAQILRHLPEKDWSPIQWVDPTRPGYAQVDRAEFSFEQARMFSVAIRNNGPALKPGETLTLTVGAIGPGIRTQLLTQKNYPFKFHYDLAGNGVYLAGDFPVVDVIARPAVSLVIHADATPDCGEPFRVKLVAVDSFGNIAEGYTGTVKLFGPAHLNGLPESCRFTAEERGVKTVTVRAGEKADFVIRAMDAADSTISGFSNLIVADGTFGKIFFGDIHTHSQLSDGRLHPFDKYREISNHRGLDFWALTDHCYDLTDERFGVLAETMERFNQPCLFATIPAYEWTPNMGQEVAWFHPYPGHRNILFRQMPKRIYNGVLRESNTPQGLKALLEKEEPGNHLIVTHFHVGDPAVVPGVDEGVEISGWCGSFVREFNGALNDIGGQTSANDAYARQPGTGATAGTDHGTEAYYTGLPAEMTAVKCARLDRGTVFDALKGGTVYATSGQKVLLKFTMNGIEPRVGSKPQVCGERALEITVGSAMPVINVVLVRNGKTFHNFHGGFTGVKTFTITDSEPLESGYYYVRAHTAQGHKTWSTPIWWINGGKE